MRRLATFAIALLAGCSVGDPDKDQPLFVVYVLSPTGGTFTATHSNANGAGGGSSETYQGNGSFQEVIRLASYGNVDSSLQEVRGSFTGASLVVGVGTRLVGGGAGSDIGAQSGSLETTEGPHQQTLPCQVRYGPSDAGGKTYRVTFRFTADRAKQCAEP